MHRAFAVPSRLVPALATLAVGMLCAAAPVRADGPDAGWRERMPAADRALVDRLSARVAAAYDSTRGFVAKDGLPSESAIELALWNALAEPDAGWETRAERSLRWTWTLWDTAMTGFYHGSADAQVGSSSYAKRTDSNARRFELLMTSSQMGGGDAQRRMARDLYGYFQRVLAEGRAGFVWGQVGDRQLYPEPNGLAIRAYLRWAAMTNDPRPRDYALRSIDATWEHAWRPMGGFWRRNFLEDIPKSATLADQVAMGRALVMAVRLAGRPEDAARAEKVGQLVLGWFVDAEDGAFRSNATPRKNGVKASGKDALDNAQAIRFLAELSHLTGDPRWAASARRAIPAFEKDFDDMKLEAADWALAVRALSVSDLPAQPEWAPAVQQVAPREPVRPKSKSYRTGAR